MRKLFCLWGVLLFCQMWVAAQPKEIRGRVFELDAEGLDEPLEGATVLLLKAKTGVYTDREGRFKLPWSEGDTIVVRHISYQDDTLNVQPGQEYYRTTLKMPATQKTVEIRSRIPASQYSMIDPIQTQLITRAELGKAACCNLGESFQANGSVDVAATDAATGSREIRLLGLAGRYSQLLTEKRPMTRGLGAVYGLNYIPGDWIESIQISKGAGSVVDGFESMTGQINVEMRRPESADPLHINLYFNNFARSEGNLIAAHKFSERVSTMLLGHGNINPGRRDPDGDGFLNNPLGQAVIFQNRWAFQFKENWEAEAGGQYLSETRNGGQTVFDPKTDRGSGSIWGLGVNTKQISAFAKSGMVSKSRPFRSGGLILSGFQHEMDSYFGQKQYFGTQQNFRASFTWQDYIGDTRHTYRTGASWLLDGFEERLQDSSFSRLESVPGVFGEYTWKPKDGFSMVAGLRADQHNIFGTLITPRLHLCYSPGSNTSLRLSAGKGYRTPNPVAENIAVLASSRTIIAEERPLQEKAWTFGAGVVQKFSVGDREGSVVLDAYRTEFVGRLVADLENPRTLRFYNIEGGSHSNVLQLEANMELLPRLDLRLAWRFQDVQNTFDSVMKLMPLTPRHFGLVNVGWKSRNEKWLSDLTLAYTGRQRIPSTIENPQGYQFALRSPGFLRLQGQVTRKMGKQLEVYVGGENLTNFMQHHPILQPSDPFGPWFDASLAWGPLMGAMGYVGLRFDILKSK